MKTRVYKTFGLLCSTLITASNLNAFTYTVTSTADSYTSGTLRYALWQSLVSSTDSIDTINITAAGTVTLSNHLPILSNYAVGAKTITIYGSGSTTINGANAYQAFFASPMSGISPNTVTVNINNLSITQCKSTGGAGGSGFSSGGGGLGAGAAVFVDAGALVNLYNVNVTSCNATGGAGGTVVPVTRVGGFITTGGVGGGGGGGYGGGVGGSVGDTNATGVIYFGGGGGGGFRSNGGTYTTGSTGANNFLGGSGGGGGNVIPGFGSGLNAQGGSNSINSQASISFQGGGGGGGFQADGGVPPSTGDYSIGAGSGGGFLCGQMALAGDNPSLGTTGGYSGSSVIFSPHYGGGGSGGGGHLKIPTSISYIPNQYFDIAQGGNGGTGGGGGGGGGTYTAGSSAPNSTGGCGGFGGKFGGGGGAGGVFAPNVSNFTAQGGAGGTGGDFGGGGGAGLAALTSGQSGITINSFGGTGGFGGGGGGAALGSLTVYSSGNFAGYGGFGGGGGGSSILLTPNNTEGGTGGYEALGTTTGPAGGGGAGLGGAIFVRSGGVLTLLNSQFSADTVTAGAAGTGGSGTQPTTGKAKGADIYVMDSSTGLIFNSTNIQSTSATLGSTNPLAIGPTASIFYKNGTGFFYLTQPLTTVASNIQNIRINQGSILLSNSGGLPNTATVTLADPSSAIFDIGSTTSGATIGGLIATAPATSTAGNTVFLGTKTLTINTQPGVTTSYPGWIYGPTGGSLVISGSGTQVLSGSNTYSGGTTVNSGATLQVSNTSSASNIGTGGLTLSGGTLIVTGTSNDSYSNTITVTSPSTISFNPGKPWTLTSSSAGLTGSGNLTIQGQGLLDAGAQLTSYTGALTLSGGATLAVESTLGSGGSFALSGGSTLVLGTSNGANFSNTLTINSGTQNLFYSLSTAWITTISGAGTLAVFNTGSSSQIFLLEASTTLAGLQISSGTPVTLTSNTGILSLSGALTMGGSSSVFTIGAIGDSPTATVGGIQDGSSAGGSVVIKASGLSALQINGSGAYSYSGSISGSGTLNLHGTQTQTLSGALSCGLINLYSGTLQTSAAQSLGASGGIALDHGTLNILSTLSTSAPIAISTSSGIATLSAASSAVATFSGAITTPNSGGTLAIGGSGTILLTNTSNNLTNGGGITINSGATLQINSVSALGGAASIGVSGTLSFNETGSETYSGGLSGVGTVNVMGGGTLTLTHSNASGVGIFNINASSVIVNGSNPLHTTGAVVFNGGSLTLLSGSSIQVGGLSDSQGTSTISLGSGALLSLNTSGTYSYAGTISGQGRFSLVGSEIQTFTAANSYSGGTSLAGTGTLIITNTQGLGSGNVTLANGTLQIGSSSGAGTLSVANNISTFGSSTAVISVPTNITANLTGPVTGTFSVGGTGILTFPNSGGLLALPNVTILSGATVRATNQALNGNITNNGTLIFNQFPSTDTRSLGVTGTGSVIVNGGTVSTPVTLTFTTASSYTGGTTIQDYTTLALSGSGSLSSTGTLSFSGQTPIFDISALGSQISIGGLNSSSEAGLVSLGASSLNLVGSGTYAYAGTIQGSGGLVMNGTGTQTLTGTNSFSGQTTIQNGTLAISNAAAISSTTLLTSTLRATQSLNYTGTITLSGAAATLSAASGTTLTMSGYIFAGTVPLNISGPGTVNITLDNNPNGYNNYSGGTNVSAGGTLSIPSISGVNIGSTYGLLGATYGTYVTINQGSLLFTASIDNLINNQFNLVVGSQGATLGVSNATIQVNLVGSISGSGPLTINSVNGGSIIMNYPSLSFGSPNSASYTGPITVSTGTLAVQGSTTVSYQFGTVNLGTQTQTSYGAVFDLSRASTGSVYINNLNGYTYTVTPTLMLPLGGTLYFNGGGTSTFYGTITGVGNIVVQGGSSVTLGGINTFSGTTTVTEASTLSILDPQALGNPFVDPNLVLSGGSTLSVSDQTSISSFASTQSLQVPIADTFTISVPDSVSYTLSGPLTMGDAVTMTKTGQGVLAITSPANSFGSTFYVKVRDGVLVANSSSLVAFSIETTNTGVTSPSGVSPGSIVYDQEPIVGDGTANVTILGNGAFVKQGPNALTIPSSLPILCSGGVYVQSGNLSAALGNNGSVGVLNLTIGAGAQIAPSITLPAANMPYFSGTHYVDGIINQTGAGVGSVTIQDGATLQLQGSGSYTSYGQLIGTGTLNISLASSGVQSLLYMGSPNFTGTVNINSGTASISWAAGLGLNNTVNLYGATISFLSGLSVIQFGGGSQTVVLQDTLNTIDVGTGTIVVFNTNPPGGPGGLVKTGSGVLSILATSNPYEGSVQINGGQLIVSDPTVLANASPSNTVLINNGSTLCVTPSSPNSFSSPTPITLGTGTQYIVSQGPGNTATFSAPISGSGGLQVGNSVLIPFNNATVALSGTCAYSGPTTIDAGTTLQLVGNGFLPSGSVVGFTSTAGVLNMSGMTTTIGGLSSTSTSATVQGSGGTNLRITNSTPHTYSGAINIPYPGSLHITGNGSGAVQTLFGVNLGVFGGTLYIDGTTGILAVSDPSMLGIAETILDATNGNVTLQILPNINNFTYSSGIFVPSGSHLGVIQPATGTTAIFSGTISGSGALGVSGNGVVNITGTFSASGGIVINPGATLQGPTSSLSTSITNNGTLIIQGSSLNDTFTGAISGSGAVTLQGSLTLTGTNTYSGDTYLNLDNGVDSVAGLVFGVSSFGSGTIHLSGIHGTLYTPSVGTLSNNIILHSGTTTDIVTGGITISGVISGDGAISGNGFGSENTANQGSSSGNLTISAGSSTFITLTGTNTYNGSTNINSGTLLISSGGSLLYSPIVFQGGNQYSTGGPIIATLAIDGANGPVAVASLATSPVLNIGQTISNTINLGSNNLVINTSGATSCDATIYGNGGIIMNGSGTQTLTGTGTYQGGTVINSGTLKIGSPINIGTSDITLGGGTLEITGRTTLSQKVVLSNAGTIQFDQSSTLTSHVQGCSLTLNLLNSLTMQNATNSFSGGLLLKGSGVLTVGAAGTLGSGPLMLSSGTSVNFNAGVATFTNPIQTLGGTPSFTTTGNLTWQGILTGSGGLQLSVPSGITLTFQNSATFGASSVSSGAMILTSGNVAFTGALGPLALPGLVSFQWTNSKFPPPKPVLNLVNYGTSTSASVGGLSDTAGNGMVILPSSSSVFPLIITGITGSTTTSPVVFAGTISDNSSGYGSIVVSGGVQQFSGQNTYGYSTTLGNGGTLMVSSVQNMGIPNSLGQQPLSFTGGTLYLLANSKQTYPSNVTASQTSYIYAASGANWNFSGTITNPSRLIKQGPGTVSFNGIPQLKDTLDSSRLTVEGGILAIDADFSKVAFDIKEQGTLTGTGSVGDVKNAGRLLVTPQKSLDIQGDYEGLKDGFLAIAADMEGKTTELHVQGDAYLGGSLLLEVKGHPKNYHGKTYSVLLVDGAMSGKFENVLVNHERLEVNLFYPAGYHEINGQERSQLFLQVSITPLVNNAISTFNTRSVQNNLTDIANSGGGFGSDTDLSNIYTLLESQTSAQNQYALDKMQPSQISAFADVEAYVGSSILSMMHTGPYRCPQGKGVDIWLQPYGAWATQDSFQDQMGFKLDNRGLSYGVGFQPTKEFSFGLGGAYDRSTVRWYNQQQKGDRVANYGGFFADYSTHAFHLGAVVLGGLDSYRITRKIQFASINRRAKSHSQGFDIMSQLSASVNVGGKTWRFIPYMNIDYFYINQGTVHEKGAQSLDLKIFRHDSSTLRTELGAELRASFSFSKGCFTPMLGLSWVRQTPLSRPEYRARFDDQSLSFRIKGWNHVWNLAAPYAGFELGYGDFQLNGEYEVETGNGFFGQKANVRLGWNF